MGMKPGMNLGGKKAGAPIVVKRAGMASATELAVLVVLFLALATIFLAIFVVICSPSSAFKRSSPRLVRDR